MTYTKHHSAWEASDFLSGAAFNHLETQWDEAKADADAHNHDARYYTKTLSDDTFFTAAFYTGFDADLLDGNHYTDLLSSVMPIGTIMIWSGTDANVPTNWHICDGGTYGGYATPDLRDRFVIGAGDTYAVNATGGPAAWNGSITPTGSIAVGDHALITAELPSHLHTYSETYYPRAGKSGVAAGTPASTISSRATNILNQTTGDGAHGHTGSSIAFDGVDPRPKYHSLYYIMKYA